jgi:hypothetical protein
MFTSVISTTIVPTAVSKTVSLRAYTVPTGINTTLRGTQTKLVRLRFPEAVDFEDIHFGVHGDGRVLGFLMRKVGYYGDREGARQEGTRPAVWATTVGQCATRGCQAHRPIVLVSNLGVETFEGDWDFYLVADGAEVSVSLDVHHAVGSKVIDVDRAQGQQVRHEIRTLTPRVHGTPDENVYSAGDFSSMKRVDFGMVGLWAIGNTHVATAYGPCVYYGDYVARNEDNADALFTPGCPSAGLGPTNSQTWITESPPDDNAGVVYIARSSGPPDAPRGLGGWFATASQVQRYGAVALWIDYPAVDTEYVCWRPESTIDPRC